MIPDIVVVLCILILAVALVRVYAEHHRLKMRSKKLSTDEALFRSVFDQAPIGIAIVTDKSFAYPSNDGAMNINRTFEKIIGRSKEELAGCQLAGYHLPRRSSSGPFAVCAVPKR